ncbi:MAG: GNAT family N-acetyltransferase [Spirochaetaceae bacterium]|nr:GNAT family N-acetyltransferase [Spirochaetaceae bacterium]
MSGTNAATAPTALTKAEAPEAAALLAAAFARDPSFAYFFGAPGAEEGVDRENRALLFCRFMVRRSLRAGDRALGIRDNGRLVACALAELRLESPWRRLRRFFAELSLYPSGLRPLGNEVLARLRRYHGASRGGDRDLSGSYLVMVGVAEEARGRGLASALIRRLMEEDQSLPGARGMGLDTENPANVALYERLGFRLAATVEVEGMAVHLMRADYAAERG